MSSEVGSRAWGAPTRSKPAEASRADRSVDLWFVDLNAGGAAVAAMSDWLDDAERMQAEAFRFEEHRRRYIVRRGARRAVLGRCLGVKPSAVTFAYGHHGKPAVAGRADLHFSASHSGEAGLIAVASATAVGIDVERFARRIDVVALADRWFAADMADRVRRADPSERHRRFLQIWTRAEAIGKLTGAGLTTPIGPPPPGVLVTAVDVGEGYAAALAVEGSRPVGVTLHRWRPDL